MKKILTILFCILITIPACAQEATITTVILLRHAEKGFDEGGDPDLTEPGRQRATELAAILMEESIDVIYTTPFKRTRQTVEPLAESKALKIMEYNPFKLEEVVDIVEKNKGKTLVFSGHSNTTPLVINMLLGEDKYRQLEDSDYDNLYFISYIKKGNAKVVQLSYGQRSK